jgi:type IV secretion system protein VirB9
MKRLGPLFLALSLAGGIDAAVHPLPGPGDARIRHIRYDPEQVIDVRGSLGYQFPIEFGDDERIENVSIGDSLGWQVTPNRRANTLFLKPMMAHATTNMTVLTSLRRYTFLLSVAPRGARDQLFGLRFDYPVPAMAIPVAVVSTPSGPPPPQDVNHAYSFSGSQRNVPDRLFDDGHFTYFGFGAATDYPAIFVGEGKKKEVMAVTSNRDGFVIVDQIAPRFVLRRGEEVTVIVNDAYRSPALGPLAPHPRKGAK